MALCRDAKFQDLKSYVESHEKEKLSIYELLLKEPDRFDRYSRVIDTRDGPILFDFSKHRVSDATFDKLMDVINRWFLVMQSEGV
ncbi:hypothetical protein Y032_0014g2352 [Ancylostoma ceylanicum]|uniref:Uncharacterized protein n=1 Tax=Ancylostoma ceylanicum TaxID=53326 RepID=A0A016VA55_9BILA|nr:hypothetical protein Y032_0014g2352 [Ancylostoma ceylanicum]